MFQRNSDAKPRQALPGVALKALTWGSGMMLTEFRLEKGAQIPEHSHPHEQIGYLVSGRMALTVGEDTFAARPGDSWCIAPDVPHRASVHEDCLVVEVFSPVREDYLP